jgi:hypothetical protein
MAIAVSQENDKNIKGAVGLKRGSNKETTKIISKRAANNRHVLPCKKHSARYAPKDQLSQYAKGDAVMNIGSDSSEYIPWTAITDLMATSASPTTMRLFPQPKRDVIKTSRGYIT